MAASGSQGSLTSKRRRALIALCLAAFGASLYYSGWLWRADHLLYDATLRTWRDAPPEDIVIVSVDEASLEAIGRWPWRRSIHASLIRELNDQGASAIGFDILFSEPDRDHPADDAGLAEALRGSSNVVLPIIVEQLRRGGQMFENLPLPALTESARGIGHVHVELDDDGIARAVYLRAGLGFPRWLSLAAMMDEVARGRPRPELPGARTERSHASSQFWSRDRRVLVPFVGPPGHIQSISYVNVLAGDYSPGLFEGKLVLVGVTAVGLGDSLPTPVSGGKARMAGVEFHANVLNALRAGTLVAEVPRWLGALSTGLFALLPIIVYPRAGARGSLLAALALLAVPPVFCYALLVTQSLWLSPTAMLAVVVLSYPLWSWTRLNTAVRFMSAELSRLRSEQDQLPVMRSPRFNDAADFVTWLLPVDGGALVDARGKVVRQFGQAPQWSARSIAPGEVVGEGAELWGRVNNRHGAWYFGQHWEGGAPNAEHLALMQAIVRLQSDDTLPAPARGTVEALERQIASVQRSNDRIGAVRRILDASLDQMADGMLVVTSLGQIMLANQCAAALLSPDGSALIEDAPIAELVAGVKLNAAPGTTAPPRSWPELIADVLVRREPVQVQATGPRKHDLLLHLAPLEDPEIGLLGFTVTVSDLTALNESERRRKDLLEFLSHDMRSPLASMLAVVELNRDEHEPGALRGALGRCEAHIRKALRLADGFAEMSRAEAEQLDRAATADLSAIARAAIETIRPQCERRNMSLRVTVPLAPLPVLADAALLERVLENLLGNAAKYGTDNSPVSVETGVDGATAWVAVSDQGAGIAPADLERIFDRFARLDSARATTGVGLGLTFVKAAVTRMGGTVGVESVPGFGSTFRVDLRRADVHLDVAAA